jgi:Tfp pilus assembly protein PilV
MMKLFRFHRGGSRTRGGFNLVEVSFTLGLLSVGFLTLAPLMGMGLKSSRWARDDRITAQIARTLTEEEKQGTLGAGPVYLDDQGQACNPTSAAYIVQPTVQSAGSAASQLVLRVTPACASQRAWDYAVVLPAGAEK